MPDEQMAIQQALNLFITEKLTVITTAELVVVVVEGKTFKLQSNKCETCDRMVNTFYELGYRYCNKCSTECERCGSPCNNGDIGGFCTICIGSNL